jgi:hypothetical protein
MSGAPDVIGVLRQLLSPSSDAELLAVDGSMISDVAAQLRRLRRYMTHTVVSVGGNDALQMVGLLSQPTKTVSEALELLANARDGFARSYRAMLDAVVDRGLLTAAAPSTNRLSPILVCAGLPARPSTY